MQKTLIEWVKNPDGSQGFTWNPITGCLNHVNGLCKDGGFSCYAYKLAHGRLNQRYLANLNLANIECKEHYRDLELEPEEMYDPFYPRFWNERLRELTKRNDMLWGYDTERTRPKNAKPIGIFLCDMGDLFGIGVPQEWTEKILDEVWGNKGYDRIYTLTKQGQNLAPWSPFPANCFVGVTATTQKAHNEAVVALTGIEAKIKFISHEPLLEHISLHSPYSPEDAYDWDIIGACTGRKNEIMQLCERYPELTPMPYGTIWTAQPKISWVEEIVRACDKAGIPVFLKDNLMPLIIQQEKLPIWAMKDWEKLKHFNLRQEMP